MAANLKIGIIADDSGAQKKFEGLSTSVDMTAKSVTALANQFANLNAQKVNILNKTDKYVEDIDKLSATTKNMHTVFNQLMNAIERQKISWGTSKDSVSALKKELSELEKVETLLVSKGVGSSFSGDLAGLEPLVQKYNEYKKELKEVIKLKEQEEIASAKALSPSSVSSSVSSSTSYKKAGLLGDSVSQMKQEYEAYSQSLTKIINTLGDGSPEAKKMAEAMSELGKRIEKAGTQTTATSVRIKNLVKNFVSAQLVVWAIRKAFTTVTNTLKESAEAASKAEETYNLFITTFENVATTAENVATRLASSMGMANSTAQKALGTFGDLAAGYGATDKAALEFGETATKVALDIISYKNISGDLDTTFQSIASGLAGNVENFRKLGYVMTQAEVKTKLQKKGLDKLTGSALQYAQIQARLEILQEKSTKAQGDMIKTLDSTENVTRRLSEAWLEYKENLGKTVNTVLTPLKKAWLEVIEQINKANQAQENFLNNGSGGGVYDVENNEKDRKALYQRIQKQWGNFGTIAFSSDKTYEGELQKVIVLMETFSTTPEMMKKMFIDNGFYSEGNSVLEKIYNDLVKAYTESQKKQQAQERAEATKNKKLEEIQSALSFIDNLNSINGISINDSGIIQRLAATQEGVEISGTLEKDVNSIITAMITALKEKAPEEFVTALDIALGNSTTEDQLEAKLSSATSVYEALWNEFWTDGTLTKEEQKSLDSLLLIVKNLRIEIENLNKEADKFSPSWKAPAYRKASETSDSMSAYLSVFKNVAQYTGADTWGITYTVQEYLEEIKNALNGGLTFEEFYKFSQKLEGNLSKVYSFNAGATSSALSSDPFSYLTALDQATGKDTLLDALEAQLNAYEEYYGAVLEYFKVDGTISTDEQIILGELLSQINGIYGQIQEEGKEKEETEGADASSLLGEWGTLASNPLQWLIDLLAQTEAVQKFGSLLSDSILPALNACLEPFLPMLEMMGSLIQSIVMPALEILFPAIKAIAKVITWVAGAVNVAIGFISDTVKLIVGKMVYSITETLNWALGWLGVNIDNGWAKEWSDTNILGNAQKRIDEMNEHLASIDKMSMEIEKNTSKDMDLSILNDMASMGLLSSDEVASLRASYLGLSAPERQTQLIRTEAGNYATNLRSGSTQNVSYGDMSIVVNSESGDPEAIAKEVARILEEWKRSGKSNFQTAIA